MQKRGEKNDGQAIIIVTLHTMGPHIRLAITSFTQVTIILRRVVKIYSQENNDENV